MKTSWLGSALLWSSLAVGLFCLWQTGRYHFSKKEKALGRWQRGITLLAFLVTAAAVLLLSALIGGDFSLKYVAEYTGEGLPLIYKISAFWAGNPGSLLFWTFVLALFTFGLCFWKAIDPQARTLAVGILLVNLLFFLTAILFFANPFAGQTGYSIAGQGLNPMLASPWMVIHPPALFLGYAGMAVPFALAAAWIILGRWDEGWRQAARLWILLAWIFLTAGNLWGAQWAYVELGWGGYWAWDPVENASLLPWLTGTALLHTLSGPKKSSGPGSWSFFLAVLTYWLTIFGTFIVRSGVISSVHAFPASPMAYWFGFFTAAAFIFSLFLLLKRRKMIRCSSPNPPIAPRESVLWLTNVLFLAAALVILFGTTLPLTSGFLTGIKREVGPEWFNRTAGPALLALVLFTAACPILRRRAGKKFFSLRLCLIHLGVLLLAAGVAADSFYALERVCTVRSGELFSVGRLEKYRITFQGIKEGIDPRGVLLYADLQVEKEGHRSLSLKPGWLYAPGGDGPLGQVAISGGPKEDLYLTLTGWADEGRQATFRVQVKPMVAWIWAGGYLLMMGTLAGFRFHAAEMGLPARPKRQVS